MLCKWWSGGSRPSDKEGGGGGGGEGNNQHGGGGGGGEGDHPDPGGEGRSQKNFFRALVSFETILRLVTQRYLREEPKNGCEGDYSGLNWFKNKRKQAPSPGSATALSRPAVFV